MIQRRRKTSVRKKEELDKEERKNKAGSLRVKERKKERRSLQRREGKPESKERMGDIVRVKERKKELTKKRWKNKIVR